VDVAAAGEIACERRRLLPHFASAARKLVVAVGEGLMLDDPKALAEEHEQKKRGKLLRALEAEFSYPGKVHCVDGLPDSVTEAAMEAGECMKPVKFTVLKNS
jgi:hypothetical protein